MPVVNLMRHNPRIEIIKSEQDLVDFLREVRVSIGEVIGYTNSAAYTLKEVATFIQKGKYISEAKGEDSRKRGLHISHEIDLSLARELLKTAYEGCQGCKHYELSKDIPGHIGSYCGKYEEERDVGEEFARSPRMISYLSTGCKEKEAKLKPLEEVLGNL